MADTKLSGRGGYVLCGIAKSLVSNILTIIKVIVANGDFITIYLGKAHDPFLHNLSIILYPPQGLLDT
jgi:hypothetical protein